MLSVGCMGEAVPVCLSVCPSNARGKAPGRRRGLVEAALLRAGVAIRVFGLFFFQAVPAGGKCKGHRSAVS